MLAISKRLYTAAGCRSLDRAAIETGDVTGFELMTRAGAAMVEAVRAAFPSDNHWLIVCGAGNNGGDGYVVARLAHQHGAKVRVLALKDPNKLQGDAATAAQAWLEGGGEVHRWPEPIPDSVNLVIDALLGTGIDREVSGEWAEAIEAMNSLHCPRIAVDIPSGLHADTGNVMGRAVRADLTVTFIGKKQGLYTHDGPDHTGRLLFDRLQVPRPVYKSISDYGSQLLSADLRRILPRRARNSHKGQFGHVLVVGGQPGMSGAVRLAAEGALRSGAGLVSVATHADHAHWANLLRPELMVKAVQQPRDLQSVLEKATVLAVGPGLGQGDWGRALLDGCLATRLPLVVDADGLNLLADSSFRERTHWVLTPHPAEAARLLGIGTEEVQADRIGAAKMLAQRFNAVVILKGCGTVLTDPSGAWAICALGNPGMSTAGSGDVLTGVVASFLGQGLSAWDAACMAAVAHAAAGDRAAERGERGLVALDIAANLREVINE